MPDNHGLPHGSIDPIWRPPLAGRQLQLAHLAAEFERAEEGGTRLTLIAGEAGIGKSRLVSEFLARLESAGAVVLFGRCDQEGLIPYQPIVEALQDHLAGEGGDLVRANLGPEWLDLRRLLPGNDEPSVDVASAAISLPSQRYRLFEGVVTLLSMASQKHSLVLVLEDLHWSDSPLLALLRHLLRNRRLRRTHIIGTYRETEFADDHPLHNFLAEVGHDDAFTSMTLGGLGEAGLAEIFEAVGPGSAAADRAEYLGKVFERTDGNPFFVLEMFRHLHEFGSAEATGSELPGGVRELVTARMQLLPVPVRGALGAAAVIGHYFDFALLQRALGIPAGELSDLLEVAVRAGHVVEIGTTPGTEFRFTHIISRDAVYQSLAPAERAAIHHRVGEALEGLVPGWTTHAPEQLAYHFERSGRPGDVERTVRYARIAGERALNALAFEDAVSYFQAALRAHGRSATATTLERCEILLRLGRAQSCVEGRIAGAERAQAIATFTSAAILARELGSTELMVRAALDGIWHWLEGAGSYGGLEGGMLRLQEDVLSWIPDEPSPERLALLVSLRGLYAAAVKPGNRERCAQEIQNIAAVLPGPEWTIQGDLQSALEAWETGRFSEAVAAFDRCVSSDHAGARPEILSQALFLRVIGVARLGDLAAMRESVHRLREFAEDFRDPVLRLYADCFFAGGFAHMRGDIQGAIAHVDRAAEVVPDIGSRHAAGAVPYQRFNLHLFVGNWDALRYLWGIWLRNPVTQQRSAVAWSAAHAGDLATANAQLDCLASGEAPISDDRFRMNVLCHFSEAAALAGRLDVAEKLYDDLLGKEGHFFDCGTAQFVVGPVGRPLGMLASLLQRWDAADAHFEAALRAAKDMEHRPAVADTTLQYARSLVARNQWADRSRAREMAEFAEAEARAMGYVPLLAQAGELLDSMGRGGYAAGLSEREVEVLRLVARGLSNREIADELVVSPATVATHIRHILDKTGSGNRAQAVAFAVRHGLT